MHQLPIELQQIIFDNLEARDRAKLYSALPKQSRNALKKHSSYHERTLSCIARAIKKNRLDTVSENIHMFLKSCYKQDPTCEPIIAKFPNIVMKCKVDNIVPKTLGEKLGDGTITIDEAKSLIGEYFRKLDNKTKIFSNLHIDSFEILWENSIEFKKYCLNPNDCYLVYLAIYGNIKVIKKVLDHREKYGITPDRLTQFKGYAIIHSSIWLNTSIMDLLLSIFSYSKAELLVIYNTLMKYLYIDGAERIERIIDNMH